MKVGLWAEIRRLAEIEKLSARVISRRLHCSWRTVAQALELEQPPGGPVPSRSSLLDPYKAKIDALLANPDYSNPPTKETPRRVLSVVTGHNTRQPRGLP